MSLSEYDQQLEIPEPTLADIEALLRMLHDEIHVAVQLARKFEPILAEMHAALAELEQFRPLLERYAAATGSPAARWARRRAGESREHDMTRRCWCGIYHSQRDS